VIFAAATVITIALHCNFQVGMLHQELRMRFDHRRVFLLDVVFVVIVIDAALCKRAAWLLELRPWISLKLRTAYAGRWQRLHDCLVGWLARLAALLFI